MEAKGFTLLELLFTLSIIAVLSAVCGVSLSYFTSKNEQQVILDEIRSAIVYAKLQALSLGDQVVLSSLDNTNNWSQGMVLVHFNKKNNNKETLYQWRWHHPHWLLEWSGMNSYNKLILSNNPLTAMSNGHFKLTNIHTNEHLDIVLNRLGRIRIKT